MRYKKGGAPSSCPANTFCFSNNLMLFVIFCIIGLIFYFFNNTNNFKTTEKVPKVDVDVDVHNNAEQRGGGWGGWNGFGSSWGQGYDLMPPVRGTYGGLFFQNGFAPLRYPSFIPSFNMNANIGAVQAAYSQQGILTAEATKGAGIMPLMGRPLNTVRDKWQYYTSTATQNTAVKLPIMIKNKNSLNEQGSDRLYNGDKVYVPGIKGVCTVELYENDYPSYVAPLPY